MLWCWQGACIWSWKLISVTRTTLFAWCTVFCTSHFGLKWVILWQFFMRKWASGTIDRLNTRIGLTAWLSGMQPYILGQFVPCWWHNLQLCVVCAALCSAGSIFLCVVVACGMGWACLTQKQWRSARGCHAMHLGLQLLLAVGPVSSTLWWRTLALDALQLTGWGAVAPIEVSLRADILLGLWPNLAFGASLCIFGFQPLSKQHPPLR